jgi:DNA-binding response OmpR family regulator
MQNKHPLIYIVEDEPELREILTEALGHIGYDIKAAPDGKTLLDFVHKERPDLILMDIGLPDMTGWDLQRTLQEEAGTRNVPVIAVTGYGGAALEQTALKTLHFADYIRKPYSLADLMNRIECVMEDNPSKTAEA